MSEAKNLTALKDQFADILCDADLLKHPEGLATGLASLDRFLVSKGIPKGALSLFTGALGTGATSVWLDTAAQVVSAGRWVAWVNGENPLHPQSLQHKEIDRSRFVAIETPDSDEKLFWTLQEMMSSGLFGLIGCDLDTRTLKEHQLRKLQVLARDSQVALVFISQSRELRRSKTPLLASHRRKPRGSMLGVYSLVLSFEKKQIVVQRALHRPTPHTLARSVSYARFTHHLGSADAKSTDTSSNDKVAISNSRDQA